MASIELPRAYEPLPSARLLSEEGALNGYLVRRVLYDESYPLGGCLSQVARRVAELFPVVMTLWGNYYFIPVNNQAAGKSLAMRILLNVGNTVSCVCLNSWAFWKMIDYFLADISPEEAKLLRSRLRGDVQVGLLATAVVIGGLAQFAVADIASVYNDGGILPAVVLLLSDGPVPACSSWMAMQKIAASCNQTAFEKRLESVRQRVVEKLQKHHADFLRLGKDDLLKEVSAFSEIMSGEEIGRMAPDDDLKNELLHLLFKSHEMEVADKPFLQFAGEKTAFGLGILLSLSHMALFAMVAYNAGVSLDGEGTGILLASLVVAASVYLNMLSISDTAQSLVADAGDVLRGAYVPSMAEKLRPRLMLFLRVLGMITTAFSYGGSIGMADEAFSDELWQKIIGISVSVAFTLFTLTAFNQLTSEAVAGSLDRWGSEEDRSLIKYDKVYSRFEELLEKAPPKEFATFLKTLPPDLYERFVGEDREFFDGLLTRYLTA